MSDLLLRLQSYKNLHVRQVREPFEFLGLETRNKYRILDDQGASILYAAEEASGLGGTLLRQILGHWRSFKVVIFDEGRSPRFHLHFPFRWFFKTLMVTDERGQILGTLEQRFALFRKKFDIIGPQGQELARINSSFFRFWTFEFFHHDRSLGRIQKKWSGALNELFTDKDNFVVSFRPGLAPETQVLMLATCIMVDIIYFENNKTDLGDLVN